MFFNLLHRRIPNFWEDFSSLDSDAFRSLDLLGGVTSEYAKAPVNVYSNEDGAVVTLFAPGVQPENIEVTFEDNLLCIQGKYSAQENQGFELVRGEIGDKNFTRKLELPFSVDSEKIGANFLNGVLTVSLPKEEALKPKKVQIKVEN